MPQQKLTDRPYCRDCFSTRRRKITRGFQKLENEIAINGKEEGLVADQIDELQGEVRGQLSKRLEEFDAQCFGKVG